MSLIDELYETGELDYAEKVAHAAAKLGLRLVCRWVHDPDRPTYLSLRGRYRLLLDGTVLIDDDDSDEWTDLGGIVRELEDYATFFTADAWAEMAAK